ncbi:hypothetical protein LOZ12_001599 [Ophidiomyces ophidiicola]|nr:hypothetical protein LOZ62_001241 [Ophidiomyces ophidiicola]KAI2009536.1 hypothetical protein LOZ50_001594 [Ophidiomyces ophidiicola]KAI2054847.1 hypothetical protein LOZ38_001142 [Ophidiomyces ophidiicola]KAI2078997.1 hypothetical protein LOZ39_001399 [Ophidiomyces ophidiicola]KAI2111440.1 hypothetical protein LOZ34_000807 [Ophidiomyces ophidiicola]
MMAVEQRVPPEAEIFAGLNNIIARSTSPKQKSYENLKKQDASAAKAQQVSAKPKYQLWPSLKKSVSSSTGRTTPESDKEKKVKTLGRSHKISVPDLGQLSTIQEKNLDSPTIPGQYPIHERSNSAPSACAGSTTRAQAPASFGDLSNSAEKNSSPSRKNEANKTTTTRAFAGQPPQSDRHQPLRRTNSAEPPEVPPKSPRLVVRIPNSQAASPGGDLSNDKSMEEGFWKSSPNLPSQLSGSSASTTPVSAGSTCTPPTSASSSSGQQFPKRPRIDEANHSFLFQLGSEMSALGINSHRRGISHDSVLKVGHRSPSKKHVALRVCTNDHEMAKKLPGVPIATFPLGLSVEKAPKVLSRNEIESLQKQAQSQAQKFEVLNRCDVKSLSRELRALQKRCDYLRETYNSLRAGRHSLHQRMISYLKSPRVSKFSREGILKQEEALFELDRSIDEWYSKLEHAEQRRALLRQKLLEHLAATLVLREPQPDLWALGGGGGGGEMHPEFLRRPHNHTRATRQDVESIKIYADAEIQALFANIEKDMERMAKFNSPPPPQLPAVAFSPEAR